MSKKSGLLLLVVAAILAVLGFLFISCAPAPPEEEVTPPEEAVEEVPEEWVSLEEAAKPWKGETLRLIGEGLPPLEALEKVKAEFEEITGVNVVIEMYGHEEVIEKTTLDFAGATGTYDLILNPHREIGRYVAAGWIQPLGRFYEDPKLRDPAFNIERDIVSDEWFRETNMYKDTMYGLPFHFITKYLWWRYDLLEHPDEQTAFKAEYGYELPAPPITWDEYLDVAEFFVRKKGETLAGEVLDHDFYGTTIQAARHVATWYGYLNVLYSFGEREIQLPDNRGDSYGPVVINTPGAVEALELYVNLLKYSPPGTVTYTWDETQAAQQTGLVAMAMQWDDAVFAVEDPQASVAAGKMAYSGIPIQNEKITQIEGWSFFIPTSSKKPELAWLFMQWAMGGTSQIAQMVGGGQSAIRGTYDNPEIKDLPYAAVSIYLKTKGELVLPEREPGADSGHGVPTRYLEAINPATGDTSVSIVAKPTFPEQAEATDTIILAVNRALLGEMTPKEALDWAAEELKRILPSE